DVAGVGDLGLLGGVVDGGGDALHPVELLLHAGGARGTGHAADREFDLGLVRDGGGHRCCSCWWVGAVREVSSTPWGYSTPRFIPRGGMRQRPAGARPGASTAKGPLLGEEGPRRAREALPASAAVLRLLADRPVHAVRVLQQLEHRVPVPGRL